MKDEELFDRTYNPNCAACVAKRMHLDVEWDTFHPLNRTGRAR